MKKRLLTILLVLVLVLGMFAFAACDRDEPLDIVPFEDGITIVIVSEQTIVSYEVDLKDQGFTTGNKVIDVLFYLRDSEGLHLDGSTSSYGYMVTEIGGLKPTAPNYVSIYTSVVADQDLASEYSSEINYKGNKVVTANFGISDLTFEKDAIILFVLA